MRRRYLVSMAAVGSLALASLAVMTLTGQTPASSSNSAKSKAAGSAVPRTSWGTPDLQGTWFVLYDVPLERSAANKDKPTLTDAEVAAANKAKETSPGRNLRSSGTSYSTNHVPCRSGVPHGVRGTDVPVPVDLAAGFEVDAGV